MTQPSDPLSPPLRAYASLFRARYHVITVTRPLEQVPRARHPCPVPLHLSGAPDPLPDPQAGSWLSGHTPLGVCYCSCNFNLLAPEPVLTSLSSPPRAPVPLSRGAPDPLPGPQPWDPTADDAWLLPQYPAYHTFVRSHLGAVGPYDATTVHLRVHRGISVALFHNPHHATR